MQSSMSMDSHPSADSGSLDVEAEITEAEITDSFSAVDISQRDVADEDSLLRRAEMYQEYMKQVPVPTNRGSLIPFTCWVGLSMSIKQLYGQPLHYLTNVLLQSWDRARVGTDSEYEPLDSLIHPLKAEATIWLVEEIHRISSSHLHIAHLWKSDLMYHSFIDPIFPE